MEELIAAIDKALDELEGRYDGAPDSPTLWMGSVIVDLCCARDKAKREMIRAPFFERGNKC